MCTTFTDTGKQCCKGDNGKKNLVRMLDMMVMMVMLVMLVVLVMAKGGENNEVLTRKEFGGHGITM